MTLCFLVYTGRERRAFNLLWGKLLYYHQSRPRLTFVSRFVPPPDSPHKSEESQVIHSSRRVLTAIARETTPISDLQDVSVMLRSLPISPEVDSPAKLSPKKADRGPPKSSQKSHLRTVSKSLVDTTVELLMTLQISAQQRTRTTLLTARAVSFSLVYIFVLTTYCRSHLRSSPTLPTCGS